MGALLEAFAVFVVIPAIGLAMLAAVGFVLAHMAAGLFGSARAVSANARAAHPAAPAAEVIPFGRMRREPQTAARGDLSRAA